MDKLVLNIDDIGINKEAFLKGLQNWLNMRGVTANGIFLEEVDPETDENKGSVQIVNNAPALPGGEVRYGTDVVFWNGIETLEPWQGLDNDSTANGRFRFGCCDN